MAKKRMEITTEEWFKELDKYLDKVGDDGLTVTEFCDVSGLSDHTVRKRIKAGIVAGRVKVGRAYRPRMDGVMAKVPVYQRVKK